MATKTENKKLVGAVAAGVMIGAAAGILLSRVFAEKAEVERSNLLVWADSASFVHVYLLTVQ